MGTLNISENKAGELLRNHNMRVTDSRTEILKLFLDNESALSQPDLERSLGNSFDRVTLYRTLTSFLESGLIHKVPDDAGAAKYALCHTGCSNDAHVDEHVHFKCMRCGATNCLDDFNLPRFEAPRGYIFSETNVLIQGICRSCNEAGKK